MEFIDELYTLTNDLKSSFKLDIRTNLLNDEDYLCFINSSHINFYFKLGTEIIEASALYSISGMVIKCEIVFEISTLSTAYRRSLSKNIDKHIYKEAHLITEDLYKDLLDNKKFKLKALLKEFINEELTEYYLELKNINLKKLNITEGK